jgi:hypothetical protein
MVGEEQKLEDKNSEPPLSGVNHQAIGGDSVGLIVRGRDARGELLAAL